MMMTTITILTMIMIMTIIMIRSERSNAFKIKAGLAFPSTPMYVFTQPD